MKKVFCILLYLCLSMNFLFSQSTYNLDSKFGFKNFKFNESFDKYKNLLTPFEGSDKLFKYIGKDPNNLFEWKWTDLNLGFHKKRLVYIQSSFPDIEIIHEDLLRNLESVFGSAIQIGYSKLIEGGFKSYSVWSGELVQMELIWYDESHDFILPSERITLIIRIKGIDGLIAADDF